MLPTLPPWEGLHPLVVHIPIGVLMTAWAPMVVGLIDRRRRGTWFAAGVLMLAIGVAGAFLAVLTGEAAAGIVAPRSQAIVDAVHEHGEAAEWARNLFVAVLIVSVGVWVAWCRVREQRRAVVLVAGGALVAVSYAVGGLALVRAGHLGGMLVHTDGIHAPLGAPPAPDGG